MSGREASAAWRPAVSAPTSAATSVANSRLTSPGARSQATRRVGERLEQRRRHRRRTPGRRPRSPVPSLARDELGVARERRDRRRTRPPRTGTRRSSSSGFRPGWRRRYALSSTASPSTTDVLDWSAPRRTFRGSGHPRRSSRRAWPADQRGRRRGGLARRRAGSPAIDPAIGHRGGQRPPGPVPGRRPRAADARSGRPCSAARTRRRARAARRRARATRRASSSKASSSSIEAIDAALRREPASRGEASRSRPREGGLDGRPGHARVRRQC